MSWEAHPQLQVQMQPEAAKLGVEMLGEAMPMYLYNPDLGVLVRVRHESAEDTWNYSLLTLCFITTKNQTGLVQFGSFSWLVSTPTYKIGAAHGLHCNVIYKACSKRKVALPTYQYMADLQKTAVLSALEISGSSDKW